MRRCIANAQHTGASCARFRHGRTAATLARTRIADVLDSESSLDTTASITVEGFVRSVRKQKNIAFAAVGDGSSFETLQAVLSPAQADRLSTGAAVRLLGKFRPSLAGKKQASELQVEEVHALGDNDAAAFPLQKKYHTPEFLRTIPHLRARSPHSSLLLRLRSQMVAQATKFFNDHGYIQTHTPILTSSDCEGAGEVFTVRPSAEPKQRSSTSAAAEEQFFGTPKFLTVSSQLHLEALAQSVGHVWTLSPTFRAEKSDTARHLSEFYMLEAEACFVDDLSQIMDLVEALIRSFAADLTERKLGEELLAWQDSSHQKDRPESERVDLAARWKGLLMPCWPRITYAQAVQTIQDAVSAGEAEFGAATDSSSGLQAEHERFIASKVGRGSPVFVTDYPQAMKPFYMAPTPSQPTGEGAVPTASCFDLLVPEVCEIVGGSMREHRLEVLEKSMQAKGLVGMSTASVDSQDGAQNEKRHALDWYLDLRRFGSCPHGGFGLGFDRLLAYLSGVHNIRDVVTFPRWYGRCTC